MALIDCPECGHKISSKAKVCINCGYPLPQKHISLSTSDNNHISKNHIKKPITKKQKIRIGIAVLVVVVIVCSFMAIKSYVLQHRDLSAAFGFSFDMTQEDIISYEAREYGNTEYFFDRTVNRLDFEKYDDEHWKHRYFFDDETGLLTSVFYSDVYHYKDDSKNKCVHVGQIKESVLKVIGNWDSGSRPLFYATGQVDGVKIKVQYEDLSSEEAIYVYRN